MPELPEVETVRRGLAPAMEGRRIDRVEARRADLRFPLPERFAARLEGARIRQLARRAKYLLARLDTGETLVMHLGMSGSFRIEAPDGGLTPGRYRHARSKAAAHDHVVFHLRGGTRIVYNDPRRFGFMLLVPDDALDAHPLFARLGIEPLSNALNAAFLAAACKGRRTSLKAALMDQGIVAGLGNIYACETLHRAHLSPRRAAGSLARADGRPTARAEVLAAAIRAVLDDAVAAGGSSLRDHIRADGSLGLFQHDFAVYGRQGEPCPAPGCRGRIRRIVQQGRSTFYCPACQR